MSTRFGFGAALLTTLLGASALTAQSAAPTPPPVRLGGFLQVRGSYQDGPGFTASINRARLGASGQVAPAVAWRLVGEFRTGSVGSGRASVSLVDALVRYQAATGGWAIQAGQFKAPFAREYLASITEIETADRSAVVDALAPKRDLGVMAEYAAGRVAGLSVGVFNGEGTNVTANADSTVLGVARVVVRPWPRIALGANGATWFGDSLRYGFDAGYEGERVTLRAEYLGQHRRELDGDDDRGWYVLGAYSPAPAVQLVARYEAFERPALADAPENRAWTGGMNLFFAERRARVAVQYVSRHLGDPGERTGTLVTQVQVRY